MGHIIYSIVEPFDGYAKQVYKIFTAPVKLFAHTKNNYNIYPSLRELSKTEAVQVSGSKASGCNLGLGEYFRG